jgi:hypothetical protein
MKSTRFFHVVRSHDIRSFIKSHDSIPESTVREPSSHCTKGLEKGKPIPALSHRKSPQCWRLDERPRNVPEIVSRPGVSKIKYGSLPGFRNFLTDIKRCGKNTQTGQFCVFDIVGLAAERRKQHSVLPQLANPPKIASGYRKYTFNGLDISIHLLVCQSLSLEPIRNHKLPSRV